MQNSNVKTIARWVALAALFLIPLTPLLISNTLFFPFITGKAFYFRTLVEIAVAAWAVLAFIDKEYRPRFSWIGVAVLAFVAWMFLADLFAVNVVKAFWSNFERMEGWVLLIHLLGFLVASSAVLRVEKKWRAWFLTSLAVGALVSVYALFQLFGVLAIHQGSTRIDATLGNSAYLAIYLLFNTFIAGWLALTENRSWLKWTLGAFAIIEAILILFTETRGTVLGLLGGLLLAALLTALTAGKRARGIAVGGLVALVIVAGGLYAARDSSFVQQNHVLHRITSINMADGAVRFTIWHMAWEGFTQSPKTVIFGWGQEGFNYVFNKYYDPSLYTQEPWFDRAHNAFIDWLSAGGLPAFLLYIALFGSVVWMLWKRSELSRAEKIALTAAVAGYACHNLFVFDNLYAYVYFFAILAFVDSQVARPFPRMETAKEMSETDAMSYALPIAAVLALAAIWYVNLRGMNAAGNLITAITPAPQPSAQVAAFESLAQDSPAFAKQEIREQMVSTASQFAQDSSVSATTTEQMGTLAVAQMQQQVAAYPMDARERLELAYAYQAVGDAQDALKQVLEAAKLSPGKESIWEQAGILSWNLGDPQGAQKYFAQAYALGPQFSDIAAYAAAGDYAVGKTAEGDAVLTQAFGTTTVDNDILAVAYYRTKDWPKLIALWQLRANQPNPSPQTLFGLAAAYYAGGESAKAIAQIRYIETLYPAAKQVGEAAIKQIESGAPIQ